MIKQTDVQRLITKIKAAINTSNTTNTGTKKIHISFHPEEIPFYDWLLYSNCSQKRYIKSQSQQSERLTLGSCKQWQFNSQGYDLAKQTLSPFLEQDFNVYTAIMFKSLDDNKDDDWENVAEMTFLIPAIEIIKSVDSIILICNYSEEIMKQEQALERYLSNALSIHQHNNNRNVSLRQIQMEPNYSDWECNIGQVLNLINKSPLQKLILARKTTFEINNNHAIIQILIESIKNEPQCNIYFQQINNTTAFLSVTPENLYIKKGKHIYCDAIAGTIAKGSSAIQTEQFAKVLQSSQKNINEHQYVVDFLSATLGSLCHTIKISKEKDVLQLAHLQHMHSVLEGTLKENISDFDLLKALHPTPATGGFPKKLGLDLIDKYECFNRGLYTGALGIMSHNFTEIFVGIRSCMIKDTKLFVYTGAGIVKDSQALAEWAELDIKMESYLSMTYDLSYQ